MKKLQLGRFISIEAKPVEAQSDPADLNERGFKRSRCSSFKLR